MKVLHTSDWHLGTWLNDTENSRLPEQTAFLDELTEICENENIDIVLVAGDIYDTFNPPSSAETLFYNAIERIAKDGARPVVVIAGNHDSPTRLTAASSLLYKHGVLIFGTPNDSPVNYENTHFCIKKLQNCCFELLLKKTGETAIVAALPYPSEKRLNERLTKTDILDERELQLSYSEKVGTIFTEMEKHFKKDTINLAISHLYVTGGEMTLGAERDVSLGGGYAVFPQHLPKNADYIALGHLHRAQIIANGLAYYSGSPIQYSASEINYSKCIYIAEFDKNKRRDVRKIFLKCPKPIELWSFKSVSEAIAYCKENINRSCYAYITIHSSIPLYQQEIKEMKTIKRDIIRIEVIAECDNQDILEETKYFTKTIAEEFIDFYKEERGIMPEKEIIQLFQEILLSSQEDKEGTESL